jgi:hypothetical protein
LTPLNTPANAGFIGGFFFARDLFPQVTNATFQGCPGSNEGEMFYLPVVDPNGQFNTFFKDKTALLKVNNGTLAHEFQHLINASRRLYVTNNPDYIEDVWLNEGMSHLAEELLYYRVAGLTPKSDLDLPTVTSTQARADAINAYQLQNLARLITYLNATDSNSPYAPNDSLPTRGATWQLLRYMLDLMPNPSSTYLHALVDSPTKGIANFNLVFGGGVVTDITAAVRQQVIAQFFDNSGVSIDPKYAFPSWNFRSVLPAIKNNGVSLFTYPQLTRSLLPAASVTFSLTAGGAGYARFRVNGNTIAGIAGTSGGGLVPTGVDLILIRTQ